MDCKEKFIHSAQSYYVHNVKANHVILYCQYFYEKYFHRFLKQLKNVAHNI